MVRVVIVCSMVHVRAIISFHGSFVSYLGASEVAPQTIPGHLQPSRPVAEHEAQVVHPPPHAPPTGSFVGASEVAPQTTLGPVQPSRPVTERKAQAVPLLPPPTGTTTGSAAQPQLGTVLSTSDTEQQGTAEFSVSGLKRPPAHEVIPPMRDIEEGTTPKDQLDIQQDLISCDVIVFETYEDGQSSERRNKAIRDLFQNAYSALLYIFERASQTTTYLADLKKRMHNVGRIEKLEHAVSLRAIFQSLEVEKQWNDLRLLIVAIACLPLEAKKEKAAARMVFNHYRSHLNAYKRTTSIKDSEALMKAYGKDEEADLVPLEITVDKNIENYTWEECVTMGNRFFGVPARPRSARPGSTILVFMVPKTLARKIEEKLSKPDIRWLMKELGVLQVHPPGICNKEMTAAISPHSIRVGLESGVDFISLTEHCSSLMKSLVNSQDMSLMDGGKYTGGFFREITQTKALSPHVVIGKCSTPAQASGVPAVPKTSDTQSKELPHPVKHLHRDWMKLGEYQKTTQHSPTETAESVSGLKRPPAHEVVFPIKRRIIEEWTTVKAVSPLPPTGTTTGSAAQPQLGTVLSTSDTEQQGTAESSVSGLKRPPAHEVIPPMRDIEEGTTPKGASKVAAQTTPVHSFMGLVKRRLEEHEARAVPPPGGAAGRQVTSTQDVTHPSDVIEALGGKADSKWRRFGTFLRFDSALMDTIESDNSKSVTDCMLDLVTKWVDNEESSGDLPRTWQTVVETVRKLKDRKLAEELEKKYGVSTVPPPPPSGTTTGSAGQPQLGTGLSTSETAESSVSGLKRPPAHEVIPPTRDIEEGTTPKGASEVAPQTTLGPVQPSTLVAEHKAQVGREGASQSTPAEPPVATPVREHDAEATLDQVLQKSSAEFVDKMNSQVIAPTLCTLGLIPDKVKLAIVQPTMTREEANDQLFQYIIKEVDNVKTVREIFDFAAKKPAYGKMNTFAKDMLKKLATVK